MGLFLIITGVVLMYRVETIIKRPQYNLKIPIEDFLEDITEWVRIMYPTRRKFPSVVVSTFKSDNAGEFNYQNNEITIYLKNNPTIEITNKLVLEKIQKNTARYDTTGRVWLLGSSE